MNDDRLPVVIGVGQSIERDETVSAMDLAERAGRAALDDAAGMAGAVERVSVINMLSTVGHAPASDLAARLGLTPRACEATVVGGNTPQALVNRAAADIVAGRLEATLIAGAEAMRSARSDHAVDHGGEADHPDPVHGTDRLGVGDAELGIGLLAPAHIYAMIDSAIAHREGRPSAEHRRELGELMAPFTEVAAKHPFAWFTEPAAPTDLATPTDDNRVVAEPYTKRLCAFLDTDQGAAVIVCSLGAARAAGLADQAVFVHAGADTTDVWEVPARPQLGASPAIAAAANGVLAAAGVGIDDVELLDLYSCFPAAVELAAEAIGVSGDRSLTLTGGLPYFGGPGNNYSTHAIATAVEGLREGAGSALVGALGWYATKHSYGLYGAAPPPGGHVAVDTSAQQRQIDDAAVDVAAPTDPVDDTATVVAATVATHRSGVVVGAPVIADLPDGRRAVAAPADPTDVPGDLVGRVVRIRGQQYEVES